MSDITKIKVDGEPESSYQLFSKNREFEKRAGGGNGGSNVQPDWNQNDDTQPDYVKNRPFYTGDSGEAVLVEESTVSFVENEGAYESKFPSTFKATAGDTYKVYWDGATYECACVNFNNMPVIGNLSIMEAGSDTGEPFVILTSDGGIGIYTADTSASHTISISGFVQEVVKIDEKYLPKGFIVNVVGTESNFGNTYLLFDKTDEEIYSAVNNGITVTLDLFGSNLQYIKSPDEMFWGVVPYTIGSNGIIKLKAVYVSRDSIGWFLKKTYITASTDSNS